MSDEQPIPATHRKVFVLVKREWTPEVFDHGPNLKETARYVAAHNLQTAGEPRFAGTEDLPDGRSIALVYEVDATPGPNDATGYLSPRDTGLRAWSTYPDESER